MSDLQQRADRYINSETSDIQAVGIITELRAHLKAANKSTEFYSSWAQTHLKKKWALEERIQDIEKKLNINKVIS